MLGGMLPSPVNERIPCRNFTGCIKNVYIDHKFLDLNNPLYNNGTTAKCPEMRDHCASKPCKKGKCVNILGTYHCECPSGFGGRSCDTGVVFLFIYLFGVASFVPKGGSPKGFEEQGNIDKVSKRIREHELMFWEQGNKTLHIRGRKHGKQIY